ncbi:hypothetical protein CJ030_MR2G027635 [Morella rubra]|uniref:GRF-type domain-containing protein n=1 Tax=Morella rubra TaxID=262757 RepID=A0A6A1WF40_9ROSI|nr:hypothetical protein CJ030_MR2G027635 [Morella rubra]
MEGAHPYVAGNPKYYPWFKMDETPPMCSCGYGLIQLRVARMAKNYGRCFYRCPLRQDHPGRFLWVNAYYPDHPNPHALGGTK